MDSAELGRRFRTDDGWIPSWAVATLVEHGHLEQVRLLAGQGDWHCSSGLARLLLDEGQLAAAIEVLRPYAETGWWEAVKTVATILAERGCTDETIEIVRPHAEAGERLAVRQLAGLLARQERVDEVMALLGSHTDDWFLTEALVELTAGNGHDAELMTRLQATVSAKHEADFFEAMRSHNAEDLLATMLERQGRVDEAVQLLQRYLRTHGDVHVNRVEHLADMLARHGREAQLRDLVAGFGGEHAAFRLADWLDEQGRVHEAVEVLRPFAADCHPNAAARLAELLTSHGWVDEAIAVLRPVPAAMGGDPEWIVGMLWRLLADHGRADEAFAFIDDFAAQKGGMWVELFFERIRLLRHCGRHNQAIAELTAHPAAGKWYVASQLADVLADIGRLDEAVTILERAGHPSDLAKMLIRQGRVDVGITIMQNRRQQKS